MTFLERWRSPRLTFLQTLVSLVLGALALTSSYWCEGKQKVPKPLCSAVKFSNCIPVPGVSNSVSIQFSWETGDDRFVFPAFHAGLFFSCEENIYTEVRGMLWLSVVMEIMYVGLLCISCLLLSLQLCLNLWFPSAHRWGQLLNSFAAVFTVLGGLLGMVAHMMFMSVFQTTASMGPEDFKPHSYGYSWAFYVAWVAFTCCMSAGVSTLNNYTKKVIMVGPRCNYDLNPCGLDYMQSQLPPAPYHTLPHPPPPPDLAAPHPSHLSPLSPYYDPPPPPSVPSPPRLAHAHSLPLPHSESFPPHPGRPAPPSPHHRHSVPSPSVSLRLQLPAQSYAPRRYSEEDYSPL
ncbi:germ cell-specific gene 1-like protein [Aplochiton taeniatus]